MSFWVNKNRRCTSQAVKEKNSERGAQMILKSLRIPETSRKLKLLIKNIFTNFERGKMMLRELKFSRVIYRSKLKNQKIKVFFGFSSNLYFFDVLGHLRPLNLLPLPWSFFWFTKKSILPIFLTSKATQWGGDCRHADPTIFLDIFIWRNGIKWWNKTTADT